MRPYGAFVGRAAVVVLALALLAGCEDPNARYEIKQAREEVTQLKKEIETLRGEIAKSKEAFGAVQVSIPAEITRQMDGVALKITSLETKIADDMAKATRANSETIKKMVDDQEASYAKRLATVMQTDVPAALDGLRQEMAKTRADLIGFMDKQLRELYPYAYQPRRMEDVAPPGVQPENK